MTRIAIISAYPFLEEVVSQANENDFICTTYPSLTVFKQDTHATALILYDVAGKEDIKQLQAEIPDVPVLLITSEVVDKQEILSLCEAVHTKPLSSHNFLHSIQRILRTTSTSPDIQLGAFSLCSKRKLLMFHSGDSDAVIPLTEKECDIICYLYHHAPVDRQSLLQNIWGYDVLADTHTVETHIYRLRQKIAEYSQGNMLITTESDGYVLTGE